MLLSPIYKLISFCQCTNIHCHFSVNINIKIGFSLHINWLQATCNKDNLIHPLVGLKVQAPRSSSTVHRLEYHRLLQGLLSHMVKDLTHKISIKDSIKGHLVFIHRRVAMALQHKDMVHLTQGNNLKDILLTLHMALLSLQLPVTTLRPHIQDQGTHPLQISSLMLLHQVAQPLQAHHIQSEAQVNQLMLEIQDIHRLSQVQTTPT